MRPRGAVRPVIAELARQSGAYIIASAGTSASDSALRDRKRAMQEAAFDVEHADRLHVDFYDRSRLATWVRKYPGLVVWVRGKIGRALIGWRPYGMWAYDPAGMTGEFLIDNAARFKTGKKEDAAGLPAIEGIRRVRALLGEPGKSVRLVGLSGVGKSRFAQALFDDRIGERCLDPSLAVYTDMADSPDPQPTGLLSDLIAARARAILVVDNCPPDLHRRLSELSRSPGSTASIITIEYDIREDEPEATEVFELESTSIELVGKLIKQRFTELSAVDAATIASFSEGNARIAIALATTGWKKRDAGRFG